MEVKGTAIRTVLVGVEEAFGADGLARVRAAVPAGLRALLEPMVLASRSYPIALSAALQEAICDELGGGSLLANHKVGAAAARLDFSGVYRVFLRVADYPTLLDKLDRAFRQYNSQGRVAWEHLGENAVSVRVTQVEGFTEPMWHAISGRLEAMFLLAGAKRCTVNVDDAAATEAAFALRWAP